jgi:phosphate/sulfate permease
LNDNIDESNFESFIKERNRRLHYQKAVLERMSKQNRTRRLFLILILAPLISAMTSLSLLLIDEKTYLEKDVLQKDISTIALNGGDLDAIKQSLRSQPTVSGWKAVFSDKSKYYGVDVPLSIVLNDIRVNAFREGKKDLLPVIEPIIIEYEEVNPFDKLQVGQKDYFENIRIKASGAYPNIVSDVNNIADELHEKNMLVEEYLSDSKMSFWISIIAVILSLLIGGYQIFASRPEAMKKLFLDAADEQKLSSSKGSNKSSNPDAESSAGS